MASAASAIRVNGPRHEIFTWRLLSSTSRTRLARSGPTGGVIRNEVSDLGGPTVEYGWKLAGSPERPADALHAAAGGEQSPGRDELPAADGVEHQIHRLVDLGEVGDHLLRAEAGQLGGAFGIADHGDHVPAAVRGELYREPADPTGCPGDQDPRAFHPCLQGARAQRLDGRDTGDR